MKPLTAREKEVMKLATAGFTNQEIAIALSISTSTVKNHMQNILGKCGVRNRTELANQQLGQALGKGR